MTAVACMDLERLRTRRRCMSICTYGDMWIFKEALEKAGAADRAKVAEAIRAMRHDHGPGPLLRRRSGEVREERPARRCASSRHPMARRRADDRVSARGRVCPREVVEAVGSNLDPRNHRYEDSLLLAEASVLLHTAGIAARCAPARSGSVEAVRPAV
jgi:hypothetical protein